MKILTDEDHMTFGKYKGTPMKDVPAHYLHWLWTSGMSGQTSSPVHYYVVNNWQALTEETPNLIWDE